MDSYTTRIGDFLIVWLTGEAEKYLAEVIKEEPLELKIMEEGPLARLKNGDYIIKARDSIAIQGDDRGQFAFLHTQKELGRPVLSGLKSLGVTDDQLHEIYPQYGTSKSTVDSGAGPAFK